MTVLVEQLGSEKGNYSSGMLWLFLLRLPPTLLTKSSTRVVQVLESNSPAVAAKFGSWTQWTCPTRQRAAGGSSDTVQLDRGRGLDVGRSGGVLKPKTSKGSFW